MSSLFFLSITKSVVSSLLEYNRLPQYLKKETNCKAVRTASVTGCRSHRFTIFFFFGDDMATCKKERGLEMLSSRVYLSDE